MACVCTLHKTTSVLFLELKPCRFRCPAPPLPPTGILITSTSHEPSLTQTLMKVIAAVTQMGMTSKSSLNAAVTSQDSRVERALVVDFQRKLCEPCLSGHAFDEWERSFHLASNNLHFIILAARLIIVIIIYFKNIQKNQIKKGEGGSNSIILLHNARPMLMTEYENSALSLLSYII